MISHKGRVKPAPSGLVEVGPLVKVTFQPAEQVAQWLKAQGKTTPAFAAQLMVDTGAQSSLVDHAIPDALGISPLRMASVVGVNQKPEEHPVYRMGMVLGMEGRGGKDTARVIFEADFIATPSSPHQHSGLIGRDFLQHVKFIYDGPTGTFEIIDRQNTSVQSADRSARRRRRQKAAGKKKQS